MSEHERNIQHKPAHRQDIYEPHVDFDFAAIERGNPLNAELERPEEPDFEELSEALQKVLDWCFSKRGISVKESFTKFCVLAAVVRPEFLGGQTYAEIGASLGVTKAAISLHAKNLERRLGVTFRRSRTKHK